MTEKQNLWSGRFANEPDAEVFDFQSSFRFDRVLFEDDIRGSLAWAEALTLAGALTPEDGATIRVGLESIQEQQKQDPNFLSGSDEDVHSFVERKLIELIGDTGKRLHTGRSRNEQVSLDLRLYLKRRIPSVQQSIVDLVDVLVNKAEVLGSTLMPSYTHLRRAQPMLAAHFFLAHIAALRRDHRRFDVTLDETDACPLGSGAVVGTGYPINVHALAEKLGFSRIVENSLDATADRDFVSSMLHGSALIMVHLSRIAEDLIIFSGEEFGFFELSDQVTTGSSLMPQKKNPDPLELVRGKTGRTVGHVSGWLTSMKGLPSGYNKDLQEDKEALFDTERTVLGSLRAVKEVVKSIEIRSAVCEEASKGLLLATDVADYLVAQGVPFRTAHEVVGSIVQNLLSTGRDFGTLTLSDWKNYHNLFGDDIVDKITPQGSIRSRMTPQSTNPDAVRASLGRVKDWVTSCRN